MSAKSRTFFICMASFWLVFGLGTTFYPRMMQLFMTAEGIAASTAFSDQVWLHGGMDILAACLLLFALSTVPPTRTTLRLRADGNRCRSQILSWVTSDSALWPRQTFIFQLGFMAMSRLARWLRSSC